MNKNVHIRDLDGKTHTALTRKAKAKGQSLSQFLRDELKQLSNRKSWDEIGRELAKHRPGNISPSETAAVIRQIRDERAAEIDRRVDGLWQNRKSS